MQHEPNTQTVMGFAKSKPYGAFKEVILEAGYCEGRSDHWKQNKALGGGAMYDMGVYALQGARYTMGLSQSPLVLHIRRQDLKYITR